ncbi:MAG TPA: helix-turn-helix transcriptional regulator [Pseudolabrys sp.]|jgi:transcriptional regulator with XRE-family HTH domain
MSTRGERIREALTARGVRKQQALAAELNVHESAVTRWKENKQMSLHNAMALAASLDVSLDWLLLGRGTMDSHRAAPAWRPADSETLGQIAQRLGPRSLSLLLAMIDSMTADASGRQT